MDKKTIIAILLAALLIVVGASFYISYNYNSTDDSVETIEFNDSIEATAITGEEQPLPQNGTYVRVYTGWGTESNPKYVKIPGK